MAPVILVASLVWLPPISLGQSSQLEQNSQLEQISQLEQWVSSDEFDERLDDDYSTISKYRIR